MKKPFPPLRSPQRIGADLTPWRAQFVRAVLFSFAVGLVSQARAAVSVSLNGNQPALQSEALLAPELDVALSTGARYLGSGREGRRIYESAKSLSVPQLSNSIQAMTAATVQLDDRPETVADRLVVLFKNDADSAAAFNQACAGRTFEGLRLVGIVSTLKGLVLEHASGFGPDELAPLSTNSHLRRIEVDYDYHLFASTDKTPNDPEFNSNQWGLRNIHASSAWNAGTDSSVLVAIIDSGIDYTHPDLVGNMWRNPGEESANRRDDDRNGYIDDVHGYNFVQSDAPPLDQNSHGSHVAGIVGAVGNNQIGVAGVNWSVGVMAVQVFNAKGYPAKGSEIANAITYAVDRGAKVLNSSWGGREYTSVIRDAIRYARDKGCLFVAAAGNRGDDVDQYPNYPSGYDLENIISVGNLTKQDQPSWDSNYGSTKVHLFAPGEEIYSTVPGATYRNMSGTSMAAPFVSGACALIWSRPVYATNSWREIKQAVLSNSRKIGALNGKCSSGGALDLAFLGTGSAAPVGARVSRTGVLETGPSLGSDAPPSFLVPDPQNKNEQVWLDFGGREANHRNVDQLKGKRIQVEGELIFTNKPSGPLQILRVEKVSPLQ